MILVDAPHAGALLLELRATGRTVAELPDGLRPGSFEEAYAIQDELHRQGGWATGALKVGCTSEFAQQALGIDGPIAGIVPADLVFSSGVQIPRSDFHHDPLLESEFALRLAADVEDAAQVGDDGRLLVDAAAPAIELVASRFDSVLGASGPSTVADNSANAALVLGAVVDPPGELSSLAVRLRCGSDELATGTGAAVLGDPYRSFIWALRHELSRGRSVPRGTWVTTGTCTGITPCPLDAPVTATFEVLGDVTLTVTS